MVEATDSKSVQVRVRVPLTVQIHALGSSVVRARHIVGEVTGSTPVQAPQDLPAM